MIQVAIVGLVSVFFATAAPAPVPKGAQVAKPFFPTTVGTKWVYIDNGKDEHSRFIGEAEKKGDEMTLVMKTTLPRGEIVVAEELIVSPRGVFYKSFTEAQVCDPPLCTLKYPITPGEKWNYKGVCFEHKLEVALKVYDLEEVEVPAGKFKAYRVEWKELGKDRGKTCWYAPGIGSVKEIHSYPPFSRVERVLKSFKPGKQ
jgi:hypothetical protein